MSRITSTARDRAAQSGPDEMSRFDANRRCPTGSVRQLEAEHLPDHAVALGQDVELAGAVLREADVDAAPARHGAGAGQRAAAAAARVEFLLHELPGLRDGDIDLGVRLGRTFRVWVPLLFGVPNQGNTGTSPGKEQACDSGLFECHSTRASHPILDDLRTLVKRVCTAKDCAIIGMCLTGSFPLSLIHDGRVVALVLAQPSLPFPRWWKPFTFFRRGIDISETQTAAAMKVASEKQASVFMIPFHGDPLSSHRSFRELQGWQRFL